MKNILIVCTANKTRSVMAMEIANDTARKKNAPYQFQSAGIALVGGGTDANVYAALEELGLNTSHAPVAIEALDIKSFDSFHVMNQRQKVTLISLYRNIDIEDKIVVLNVENPFMKGLDAYRECCDKLRRFYESYIEDNR